MNAEFFELSLGLQVALGSGYLAYVTAYAGLRKGHDPHDTVFISLAFAAIGLIVFQVVSAYGSVLAAVAALISCLVAGAIWRAIGRAFWQMLMRKANVHREDGVYSSWDSIVQTSRRVGQISVHLRNGRVLYLDDRRQYSGVPWEGLYLGGDGSVVMVVELEEMPDGKEEIRTGVVDAEWGTRLTYIPAAEIERVNIRMK